MKLTDAEKTAGRENFLKAVAQLPPVSAFPYRSAHAGPVKVGIVGTGNEGRILINAMNPKYTYIMAMCDIRPDHTMLGKWVIGQAGHARSKNLKYYEDYKELCQDPEIEAVVIATPLHTHAPIAIEAMKNGKHVMTEKTMAYTTQDCLDMIKVSKENNVNLQIGHMRFYNPLYWNAFRMLKAGLLGNVYHIRAMWHRNTDWNYWYHIEEKRHFDMLHNKDFDPTKWGYKNLEHLVNWRWYKETSHGLWTELCSHQVAITNWLFGDENSDVLPTAVTASGGKYKTWDDFEFLRTYELKYPDPESQKWHKNYTEKEVIQDRSINDHVYAMFEYPGNRTVSYSAIQSNSLDNCYEQIMGTFGTIILANENEYYLFWERGWDASKAMAEASRGRQGVVSDFDRLGEAYEAKVSSEAARGYVVTDIGKTEPYKWEFMGFADTIRRGAPNLCDGRRATYAAQAVYSAQKALQTKKRVEIQIPQIA